MTAMSGVHAHRPIRFLLLLSACLGAGCTWIFSLDGLREGAGESGDDVGSPEGGDSSSGSGSGSSSGGDPGAEIRPSCAPGGAGMTNCGTGSQSCCTSLEVTGGTYYRTYLNNGAGAFGQADPATVNSFRLDEYEVTVGRFRQFVGACSGVGGCLPAAGSGKHVHLNGGRGLVDVGAPADAGTVYETGWNPGDDANVAPTTSNLQCDPSFATWTPSPGSNENLPINCVNWYEAYAFCIWDGGFLPSEAEWEYAAAGGAEQREYPWGSASPGTACPGTGCSYAIYDCDYPNGSDGGMGTCTGVTNIAPVGTATQGAGLYGQIDLSGNVWEWTLDWYASYVNPCTDGAYLEVTSGRVPRGAYFGFPASSLVPFARGNSAPTYRSYAVGFRCARAP